MTDSLPSDLARQHAQGKAVGRMEFVLFTDVSPRYGLLCQYAVLG